MELQDRLNAVSNVELSHDVRHVLLYGSLGAIEASRDLLVGHAPRYQRKDFLLARRKIMEIVVADYFSLLAPLDQQPRREVRRHIGVASKDGPHGLDHFGSAAALEN